MSMFLWTPDMVRFMKDASEHSPYHTKLANALLPDIAPDETVCDAGCGLGYLSLALAESGRTVTAVDCNPAALAVLNQNLETRTLPVSVIEGDIFTMPPPHCDVCVFCLFGHVDEALAVSRRFGAKKAILIKKDRTTHQFSLLSQPPVSFTLYQTTKHLELQHISYTLRTISLPMDQPFHTLADAVTFFCLYDRSGHTEEITESLVRSYLIPISDSKFPYRYPVTNHLGLITIQLK